MRRIKINKKLPNYINWNLCFYGSARKLNAQLSCLLHSPLASPDALVLAALSSSASTVGPSLFRFPSKVGLTSCTSWSSTSNWIILITSTNIAAYEWMVVHLHGLVLNCQNTTMHAHYETHESLCASTETPRQRPFPCSALSVKKNR